MCENLKNCEFYIDNKKYDPAMYRAILKQRVKESMRKVVYINCL